MINFVSSTIPLTQSIHAPQPTSTGQHPKFIHSTPADNLARSSSRLSTGTVTSFNHHHPYAISLNHPHHHHPSSSSAHQANLHHLGDLGRSVSPTPSRASVISRVTMTMDQDGWWSSQDY
ncbi:hypothetical protein PGT21_035217 [Puccinia graminis f. sp. tritici]|nr:hypothetical protein PGT21_035217 [Puccinia graminis f. sp. tritici]